MFLPSVVLFSSLYTKFSESFVLTINSHSFGGGGGGGRGGVC